MLDTIVQYSLPISLGVGFVVSCCYIKLNKSSKSEIQYADLSNRVKKIKKFRSKLNETSKASNKQFFR